LIPPPDKAGLSDWLPDAGLTLDKVHRFYWQRRIKALYGAKPATQFVDLLYANVLNCPADASGYGYRLGDAGRHGARPC
jgi:hypothetical protein